MYTQIHPMNVENSWPLVAPWIAMACGVDENSWNDIEYIKPKVVMGMMQLWVGYKPNSKDIDLVLITEGTYIGARPTLIVRYGTAQDLKEKLPDFGLLEQWAKSNGFVDMEIWGRPGFAKLMKPLGFVKKFEVLGRTIDRGVH